MLHQMADEGMKVPSLESEPTLTGYAWLWEGFSDLNTCREVGFNFGQIPWTAVQQYIDAHSFNATEAYLFHKVIKHMDGIWLKHARDAQKGRKK